MPPASVVNISSVFIIPTSAWDQGTYFLRWFLAADTYPPNGTASITCVYWGQKVKYGKSIQGYLLIRMLVLWRPSSQAARQAKQHT